MIEIVIKNYLESVVDIPVYLEIPAKNTAQEFYTVELVGGGKEDEIGKSSITIESYGSSLYRSALLDEQMREYMKNAVQCAEIYGVNLNSHYNATDTERNIYKYKALFDINHY